MQVVPVPQHIDPAALAQRDPGMPVAALQSVSAVQATEQSRNRSTFSPQKAAQPTVT
jgi:hypothetical protein